MKNELSIAFIGKGGIPARGACGRVGKVCPAGGGHVIDINQDAQGAGRLGARARGAARGKVLAHARARKFATQARNMKDVVACARQWLQDDTLSIRGAARTMQAKGSGT